MRLPDLACALCLVVALGCGDDDGIVEPDTGMPDSATPDAARDAARDAVVADAPLPDAGDAAMDVPADTGSGPTIVDISDPTMDPRQSFAVGFVGDGRVIFAGGSGGVTTPVETWSFDPVATTWTRLADLPAPHVGTSSIVLPDGRMLISGGVPAQFALESNDAIFVFDPTTSMWSPAGTMTERRGAHSVYMLNRGPDAGKIVMFGGNRRTTRTSIILTTFELYDPASGMSTPLVGTEIPSPRASYFSYELDDGRIVIAGGFTTPGDPSGSAIDEILIYDPMDHSVTPQAATLPETHLLSLLGTLPDGRALVFPGRYSTNTIRAMDRETFAFTDIGAVPDALSSYGLAKVPSGTVYLFGGREDDVSHTNINQYDPVSGEWSLIPDILPLALAGIRPTALPDGRVVLMGGQTDLGFIVGETNLFVP